MPKGIHVIYEYKGIHKVTGIRVQSVYWNTKVYVA